MEEELKTRIVTKYNLYIEKESKDEIFFSTNREVSIFEEGELEQLFLKKVRVKKIESSEFEKKTTEKNQESRTENMLNEFDTEFFKGFNQTDIDKNHENIEELAYEAPVINLVNSILSNAVKKKASDIHIEALSDHLIVRYRVDGIMLEILKLPFLLIFPITTRIKIISNLDIAERRLPQDGRTKIKISGREIDLRIAVTPSINGENITIRLLDKNKKIFDIDKLGMDREELEKYKNMIRGNKGIILVTGPTGSGKTTMLYATIDNINDKSKKIITIEDPVEYHIEGITQIQVKQEIGLDFSNGLRSILRQDPDIIMIGEIRDAETAKIAVQAALTGHGVFATLHTGDSFGAISRLIDLGVDRYLVAEALRGVIAQRLVRKKCSLCNFDNGECNECNGTGYSGRTGIFEILEIDGEIAGEIRKNSDMGKIKKLAEDKGLKTIYMNGEAKVRENITTLEELERVCY